MVPPLPSQLAKSIAAWPDTAQSHFKALRGIVHRTANDIPDLSLIETLKWGQPSWLPDRPRVGSTLRAGWSEKAPHRLSLFVNCQTTLAGTLRDIYPNAFEYEGNRALHFDLGMALPRQAVAHCAALTLTYHRQKLR